MKRLKVDTGEDWPTASLDDLPPEFNGDPDPRHREHLYRARTGLAKHSPLVSFEDVVEAVRGQTSSLEKRCIADVLAKSAKGKDGKPVKGSREKVSRAYAICRASLQKSGRYKKGTADLTKLGAKRSAARSKVGDHKAKLSKWKKAIVAARKK